MLGVVIGFPSLGLAVGLSMGLGSVLSVWLPRAGYPLAVALVVTMAITAIWLFHNASQRRAQQSMRIRLDQANGNLHEILNSAVAFLDTSSRDKLDALGVYLIATGQRGICVRFASATDFWTVVPIDTTFEALPIDEFDPRAGHFLHSRASPSHATGLLETAVRRMSMPAAARAIRRFTVRGEGLIACYAILFLGSLLRGAFTGSVDWMAYVWGGILLWSLFFCWGSAPTIASRYLLLPGGLLIRRPIQFGRGYQLHVFDRRESVLVIAPADMGQWFWYVADERDFAGHRSTRLEVELLLAAWFSPHRPPAVEALAELA